MPKVIIKNDTQVPLHIALRQISPLHFVNNVPPGGEAVFKHVGRVWFTIEARLARTASAPHAASADDDDDDDEASSSSLTREEKEREEKKGNKAEGGMRDRLRNAKENNEYTMIQSVAAPVAVSVAALSLGAGAVYLGVAASAAGGVSAALSTIGAQAGATAASTAPSVQRLYKYAKKGYKVAQIGQVVGLGGKAIKDATAASAKDEPESADAASSSSEGAKQIQYIKDTLAYLINDSVVKSHGWYMKHDRTFSIRGGPRAAELEEWVIIETDTVAPFEVLSDNPNEKPDPKAMQDALSNADQDQTHLPPKH